MTIKEWLRSTKSYSIEIESVDAELLYFSTNRTPFSEERISHLIELRENLVKQQVNFARIIDKLEDPVLRAIFKWRYIHGETWERIGKKCGGMSARNAHYIHDKALPDVEKFFWKQ